jgi:WD40 repeat protein
VVRTWVVGDRIKSFTMLPDGQHALTSSDHDVRIWSLEHDEPVASAKVSGNVVAWALSAQGLLAVATEDDELHAFAAKGYSAPFGIDSRRAEHEM